MGLFQDDVIAMVLSGTGERRSQHSTFSGEFAKSREAKSNEKGRDAFLSEFLENPHCVDPGLNHGRFLGQHRDFIEVSNQSMRWNRYNLDQVGCVVVCEAIWYNG